MAKKKAARKWTASELMDLIRCRYAGEAYVVVEQVAQGTGSYARSWIDAAVFSLWPSKGLYRSAFEIKSARNDFIRELRQPDKNEWARECFHEFWFVAPSGVIKESELPEGAGWMRPHGDTLATIVHAKRKKKPRLDDVFLAAVVRAIQRGYERQQTVKLGEKLTNDPEVARARAWRAAGERYLAKMGARVHSWTKDDDQIFDALMAAKHDDRIKDDRDHVMAVLARFQNEVLGFLDFMAVIGSGGLLARDEAGSFVLKTWGGHDGGSFEALTKWAKKRGAHHKKKSARGKLGALRALLELRETIQPKGITDEKIETKVPGPPKNAPGDGARSPFDAG